MKIKILGTGCPKCKMLEKLTTDAIAQLNINADIEKVDDIAKIMSYGIISTPGLVINEKVILSGRIPSINELKELIQKYI